MRLETVGLESNCIYLITRFVQVNGVDLIEFLEIDGEGWIGKLAKVRSFWTAKHPEIQ